LFFAHRSADESSVIDTLSPELDAVSAPSDNS